MGPEARPAGRSGLRVAVFGAAGRMGSTVCRAVAEDPDLELVGAVDPAGAGRTVAEISGVADDGAGRVVVRGRADELDAGAEVAVDFSRLDACLENLAWCAAGGLHAVVGTSGFGPAQLERLAGLFPTGAGRPNCLVVPNFAVSAVLALRFAELAAPWFETAEVIELHHDGKVDAPSGTAIATAERLGAARRGRAWASDPTRDEPLPGARGALHPSGVHIHAVRMRGMVAHEEIILGMAGQTLTIRQDSYDRQSFMPGVLMAIKAIPDLDGLTVGLERVLGM